MFSHAQAKNRLNVLLQNFKPTNCGNQTARRFAGSLNYRGNWIRALQENQLLLV